VKKIYWISVKKICLCKKYVLVIQSAKQTLPGMDSTPKRGRREALPPVAEDEVDKRPAK
jgi:hypothetical protein